MLANKKKVRYSDSDIVEINRGFYKNMHKNMMKRWRERRSNFMIQGKKRTMEINEKTSMLLLAGPIFVELLLNILLNL